MKKNKTISIILIILSVISIGINTYAHSGRTDASGGHKDNKNKSGLGSYHYHCGGNPPHSHTGGVCPYSSGSSSSKSSTSSSSSSSTSTKSTSTKTTTTTTKSATIAVTEIQINENVASLEVGKSKVLTATITPSDATDKSITWKSSNESVATVSTTGILVAKQEGTVDITATSNNGKTSTIKINIKEAKKPENNTTINTVATKTNNTTNNKKEDSNALGGILTLGLLGGGGYWGYQKYKKRDRKEEG